MMVAGDTIEPSLDQRTRVAEAAEQNYMQDFSDFAAMLNGTLWVLTIIFAAVISQAFINHPGLEAWVLLGASMIIGGIIIVIMRDFRFQRKEAFDKLSTAAREVLSDNSRRLSPTPDVIPEPEDISKKPISLPTITEEGVSVQRPTWIRPVHVIMGFVFDVGVFFQLGFFIELAITHQQGLSLLDPINAGLMISALVLAGLVAWLRWKGLGRELESENTMLAMIVIVQVARRGKPPPPSSGQNPGPWLVFFATLVSGVLSYGAVQIMLPHHSIIGTPHWLSLVTGLVVAALLGGFYAAPDERHSLKVILMTALHTMITIYATLFFMHAVINVLSHTTWAQLAQQPGNLTGLVAAAVVSGLLFGVAYWKQAKVEDFIAQKCEEFFGTGSVTSTSSSPKLQPKPQIDPGPYTATHRVKPALRGPPPNLGR